MILQPDVCYAGGITELKIIAGMAEAYYTPIAPHNPAGSVFARGQPADRRFHPQLPDPGARRQRYTDLLAKPLPPVVNGYRPLLTEPGLGITIDENKLMAQVGEPGPICRSSTPTMAPWSTGRDGTAVPWRTSAERTHREGHNVVRTKCEVRAPREQSVPRTWRVVARGHGGQW